MPGRRAAIKQAGPQLVKQVVQFLRWLISSANGNEKAGRLSLPASKFRS
jgi:hypothetical protein